MRAGPRTVPADPSAAAIIVDISNSARPVADARRVVRDHLARHGLSDVRIDNAVIVSSELVANAESHAGGAISVIVSVTTEGRWRIEVRDGKVTTYPMRLRPEASVDEGGRGLVLVAQLSREWGAAPEGVVKVVWAEENYNSRPSRHVPQLRQGSQAARSCS